MWFKQWRQSRHQAKFDAEVALQREKERIRRSIEKNRMDITVLTHDLGVVFNRLSKLEKKGR